MIYVVILHTPVLAHSRNGIVHILAFFFPFIYTLPCYTQEALTNNFLFECPLATLIFSRTPSLSYIQMAYLKLVAPPEEGYLPFPSETIPYLINAHIGTHVSQRHISDLLIRYIHIHNAYYVCIKIHILDPLICVLLQLKQNKFSHLLYT